MAGSSGRNFDATFIKVRCLTVVQRRVIHFSDHERLEPLHLNDRPNEEVGWLEVIGLEQRPQEEVRGLLGAQASPRFANAGAAWRWRRITLEF